MARVAQVQSGQRFEKSGITPTRQKSFRIVRDIPGEFLDFENLCKVRIGSRDAENPALRCVSYTAEPEGESRLVWLATFTYTWTPMASDSEKDNGNPYIPDPLPQIDENGIEQSFPEPVDGTAFTQAPDVRPANWYIQSSLIESPVYSWKAITGPNAGQESAPKNSAQDLYEGISRLEPVVSIHVQQFMWPDPTANAMHVGKVNEEQWTLGQMVMPPRSVMLRAMNTQPHNEIFDGQIFRGWMATYEFLYRRNFVGSPINAEIGWDWAQPQSGFNVLAFNPNNAGADQDLYGQPLRHAAGRIPIPLSLPDGINAGDKVRAMVRIAEVEGGITQLPSAQPIALNNDGTPRLSTATPPVLVYRYKIYDELDFDILGVRLQ